MRWNAECPLILSIASLCFTIRDQQQHEKNESDQQAKRFSLQEERSERSRGLRRSRERSGEHQHCEIPRHGPALQNNRRLQVNIITR